MVGCLILGVAFALRHHFFYRYCNGKEAHEKLPQQWVTRAGTAFTFCGQNVSGGRHRNRLCSVVLAIIAISPE